MFRMTTHVHRVHQHIYRGNNYRRGSMIKIRSDYTGSKFIKNVCATHYERDVIEKKDLCPMHVMKENGNAAAQQVSK